MLRNRIAFFLILFTALSCGKPVPVLEGFDRELWKGDPYGCKGQRLQTESALKAGLEKIKGLKEMDVIELLGRADRNELYERNQKFYYYYIQGGPTCGGQASTSRKLTIRLNAMGYAQVVVIVED